MYICDNDNPLFTLNSITKLTVIFFTYVLFYLALSRSGFLNFLTWDFVSAAVALLMNTNYNWLQSSEVTVRNVALKEKKMEEEIKAMRICPAAVTVGWNGDNYRDRFRPAPLLETFN